MGIRLLDAPNEINIHREKMQIKEGSDGILWFREGESGGWFHLTDSGLNPGEVLDKLVKDEMNEHKDVCFSEAFTEVQRKYPGITKQYQEQLRKADRPGGIGFTSSRKR